MESDSDDSVQVEIKPVSHQDSKSQSNKGPSTKAGSRLKNVLSDSGDFSLPQASVASPMPTTKRRYSLGFSLSL
jgi:hypothetical protein